MKKTYHESSPGPQKPENKHIHCLLYGTQCTLASIMSSQAQMTGEQATKLQEAIKALEEMLVNPANR